MFELVIHLLVRLFFFSLSTDLMILKGKLKPISMNLQNKKQKENKSFTLIAINLTVKIILCSNNE